MMRRQQQEEHLAFLGSWTRDLAEVEAKTTNKVVKNIPEILKNPDIPVIRKH